MKTIKNTRQHKVEIEIKKVLSEFLLLGSIFDEKHQINTSLIAINDVLISPCLQHTKVFIVSVSSEIKNEDCVTFLEKHKSKFRNYLGKKCRMKYVPDIKFFVDDSFENAARIEGLIKKLHATTQE